MSRRIHRMFLKSLLLAAVPFGLWLFLRWFERSNVYQPTRDWIATPDAFGRKWEAIQFQAADGVALSGWFLPASDGAKFRDLVVLVSHGNGGNISHRFDLYDLLLDAGLNVFAFDYRGYGRSGGRPTESGTYRDGEAALEVLHNRHYPDSRIVVFGESLGGGIAAELALTHPSLRGLILQNSFTSIPDLGAELFPYLPVRWVGTIHYDTHSKLPRIRVPVRILHSREDTLIRFHHAEANLAAAVEPKALRETRGDHNDSPALSREAILQTVQDLASNGNAVPR